MKNRIITKPLCAILSLSVAFLSTASAAALSDNDKEFLAAYEKAHAALAADDLATAKIAGKDLGPDGAELTKSDSLADARAAFEKLSAHAKHLTMGQPGYYVVHCPMVKKDWVQTSTKVANPYGGKAMASCGQIQK